MKIWLAIPTMNQKLLNECLRLANSRARNDIHAMVYANGIALNVADGGFWHPAQGYEQIIPITSMSNLGVVPALQAMYDMHRNILEGSADDIIGYMHDDVYIQEDDWDEKLSDFFARNERIGLVGFHGALGLADADIYKKPYELTQLARQSCFSNMQDAEIHGMRTDEPRRVSTVDGFSLFCRRRFLDQIGGWKWWPSDLPHHSYDNALACMAARWKWETWLYPLKVHHLGGRTSTRVDFNSTFGRSESEIHSLGHDWLYENFRDVLPLRVQTL